MKKIVLILLLFGSIFLTGCQKKDDNKVVIWTSGEDYKNEYYLSRLEEQFPDLNIVIDYMSSSEIAAKIIEEGSNTACDIIISEEYGYLAKCEDYLQTIDCIDFSVFLDDIVPTSHKYSPEVKNGGAIIINKDVIKSKNLDVPISYADLLKDEYKNLISMPNPTSSGTGYMFLRQLTNEWGEDEAFAYFKKLTNNILQFTTSGSGPINSLIQGEVAIGLGMTSQAVVEINEGINLEILFFDEGSPYSMYGNAIIKKDEIRDCVIDVFKFVAIDVVKEVNEKYFPDQIFKNFTPSVKGYPTNIDYGDMSNDTRYEKDRLLEKWEKN